MKKTLVFLLCCVVYNISAQSEASNWYFGDNAGIRFNADGTITSLSNGQLSTEEGCTSISDNNGDLLFYTDGRFVYDRNNNIMPNGSNLYGDKSSTQSAIIIPNPGNLNIYYVFTVDTSIGQADPDYGFNYSIVDISLNGGLGDVVSKNLPLLSDSSEKISAVVKDCQTKSIWVITFASQDGLPKDPSSFNTFYAYEVTALGINTTPVKSTFNINISDGRGYLKFSPDGTKLVCANATSGLYLYDFDTSSGTVSNQKEITINFSPSASKPQSAYGVEFSQNNNVLYVSAYYNSNQQDFDDASAQYGSLLQYDLSAPNISSSEMVIDKRQMYRGGLQLGPDGKIYRAMSITYNNGSPFLSVINSPNVIGIGCNYVHNAIPLTRNSRQGLPPFIASFFSQKIDIIGNNSTSTNLQLCNGDTYILKGDEIPGAIYQWTLNGVALTETDFDLNVSLPGLYKVLIDPNNGDCDRFEGQAYVVFNPNPEAFNVTLLQCDEDGIVDGKTLFNLNEANANLTGGVAGLSTKFYTDPLRTIQVDANLFGNTTNPQTIYVEVFNVATDCFDTSELILDVSITDSNNTELIVCDDDGIEDGIYNFNLEDADNAVVNGLPSGLNISYFETYEDALLEQNNLGAFFKNNSNPYSQTIYARVENTNNCYGISEVLLTVNELPDIKTEDITYYCLNRYPETITINASILNDSSNNYTYVWSNGETTYSIEVNEPGTYKVNVTNANNCSKERTIMVDASNIASIQSINVVDASQNNIITVNTSGEGTYEYQLLDENNIVYRPYQDNHVFENITPGFYTVYVKDVKNDCGSVNSLISVIGFPKYFTPNNDGFNDTWQVYGVSSLFQPNSKIYIFDRYGKLLKELNLSGKGWDGSFNGKKLPTDDYWFSVALQDGRIFKSHFTLKR
ncbi:T9SS type B sorting domain-containing protein [Yeosuana sp.]|uniref:T9SS type B sorting domain-containing protein n=1 Tax=Yeosuana sp. TaxID=2529388 RepID=UPI004054BDC1